MIEHLYCTGCETNPSVAKIDGHGHLVCQCTHEDGHTDPLPLGSFVVLPVDWEFRPHYEEASRP